MFIIMAETLNAVVKHAMVVGNLKGITLPQDNSQHIISPLVFYCGVGWVKEISWED